MYQSRNTDTRHLLVKANGLDITREEAEAYLAEMDDMELDSTQLTKVAGGACWHGES